MWFFFLVIVDAHAGSIYDCYIFQDIRILVIWWSLLPQIGWHLPVAAATGDCFPGLVSMPMSPVNINYCEIIIYIYRTLVNLFSTELKDDKSMCLRCVLRMRITTVIFFRIYEFLLFDDLYFRKLVGTYRLLRLQVIVSRVLYRCQCLRWI